MRSCDSIKGFIVLIFLGLYISGCTTRPPSAPVLPPLTIIPTFSPSTSTPRPATSTPRPPTSTPAPKEQDIIELIHQGVVETKVEGNGITSISLGLRSLVNQTVFVNIPIGTYFVANSGTTQNMVATKKATISLIDDNWTWLDIEVACANIQLNVPYQLDQFTIQQSANVEELQMVLDSIQDVEHQDNIIIQAVVWIITDNASYYDLGTLVYGNGRRAIDKNGAALAMKIIDEAGIDVSQKAIWYDRDNIFDEISDEELVSWLQQKEASLPHAAETFIHTSTIKESALSPDGKMIAIGDENGVVRLWDIQTEEGMDVPSEFEKVTKLAFSPDGSILAISDDHQTVSLWDIKNRTVFKVLDQEIKTMAFSPDGKMLAAITTNQITLFDSQSWDKTGYFGEIEGSKTRYFDYSPDGRFLVLKDEYGITIWSTDDKQVVKKILDNEEVVLPSLDFSPDGVNLAYVKDFSIYLYNLNTGDTTIFISELQDEIINIAFSPDGSMLSAETFYELIIWDIHTRVAIQTYPIELGIIFAESDPNLSFTPDGQFLVVTIGDEVGFWEVKSHK